MRLPRLGAVLGAAIVVGGLARQRIARFEVAEASMAPTLEPGDWIVATRMRRPHRGDVVVYPLGDIDLVKRVIGLPGQVISIAGGQVHIDGETLAEPWADGPTFPDGEWSLAGDEVFCLGDGRGRSSGDSRHVGPVVVGLIRWRVRAVYWPRLRLL
ncbi:MAG: signal peptidase I [Acidimicrobiia bacterium]|nr:signal peptidase I [Acidimicrobiia bacterium]NNC74495.1 signal peptidase I [Acidimicrobiia bacterium]